MEGALGGGVNWMSLFKFCDFKSDAYVHICKNVRLLQVMAASSSFFLSIQYVVD